MIWCGVVWCGVVCDGMEWNDVDCTTLHCTISPRHYITPILHLYYTTYIPTSIHYAFLLGLEAAKKKLKDARARGEISAIGEYMFASPKFLLRDK